MGDYPLSKADLTGQLASFTDRVEDPLGSVMLRTWLAPALLPRSFVNSASVSPSVKRAC